MSLKNAAFLALVGMILQTVLLATGFVTTLLGVLRDVTPAMTLASSLIRLLASLGLTIFLYVFHSGKS